jgi:hypothetical protein
MQAFCHAGYPYYDAIRSDNANPIDPIDVLATVSMNSFRQSKERTDLVARSWPARMSRPVP